MRLGAYYAVLDARFTGVRGVRRDRGQRAPPPPLRVQLGLPGAVRGGRAAVQRHVAGPPPRRVHRAHRPPVLGRHPGPPGVQVAARTGRTRCSASWSAPPWRCAPPSRRSCPRPPIRRRRSPRTTSSSTASRSPDRQDDSPWPVTARPRPASSTSAIGSCTRGTSGTWPSARSALPTARSSSATSSARRARWPRCRWSSTPRATRRSSSCASTGRRTTGRSSRSRPGCATSTDEPVVDTIARELVEEAGVRAGRLEPLVEFYPSAGMTDSVLHLYLATDLTPTERDLHGPEEEAMDVLHVPLGAAHRHGAARRDPRRQDDHRAAARGAPAARRRRRCRGLVTQRRPCSRWRSRSC